MITKNRMLQVQCLSEDVCTGCSDCIHSSDSDEECLARKCVHAAPLFDAFERKPNDPNADTNYDMIKKMNLNELAEYIEDLDICGMCVFYDNNELEKCTSDSCSEGIKQWLMLEANR